MFIRGLVRGLLALGARGEMGQDGGMAEVADVGGTGRGRRRRHKARRGAMDRSVMETLEPRVFLTSVPPSAPENLTATALSSSAIQLTWDAPPVGDSTTSYAIYISRDNGQTFESYTALSSNTLSLKVTDLDPASPYRFKVEAVNNVYETAASVTPVVWTLLSGFVAPTDVTATPVVIGHIIAGVHLEWTNHVSDVNFTGYKIHIEKLDPTTNNYYFVKELDAGTTSYDYNYDSNQYQSDHPLYEMTFRIRVVCGGLRPQRQHDHRRSRSHADLRRVEPSDNGERFQREHTYHLRL